jgi:hypothetical protein
MEATNAQETTEELSGASFSRQHVCYHSKVGKKLFSELLIITTDFKLD